MLEIVELDPRHDADLRAWHQVYLAAEVFEREAPAPWQYDELAAQARTPNQYRERYFLGRVDGAPVACSMVSNDTLSNQTIGDPQVHVLPSHRRLGHGSALLALAEDAARAWGCTTLMAEASWSSDSGPSGDGSPGREFARRHGYRLRIVNHQRELALPVDGALLTDLSDSAAHRSGGHRLVAWTGAVPDDIAEGVARLQALVGTEAPMGDLEFEEESPDVDAMRQREAVQAAQGRTKYGVAALSSSGFVAAYTDLVTTIHEPGVAYQWGTLVDREHRGHRLGLAIKVENVRRLIAERPDITRLVTYNALDNPHMVDINDLLGFVPVEYLGEFQKRLGPATDKL